MSSQINLCIAVDARGCGKVDNRTARPARRAGAHGTKPGPVGGVPPRRHRQRGGGARGRGLHRGHVLHLGTGGTRGRAQAAAATVEGSHGADEPAHGR